MEGQYVVAIYDFTETESGDLGIYKGDVVRIVKQIDDNWLEGQIQGKTGNFPRSFVQVLNLPDVLPAGQKLFACCTDYRAETPNDLTIMRGDVIVGTSAIDEYWWRGQKQFTTGAFPLSHVYELDLNNQNVCENKKPANVLATVRAITNLSAQLDTELPLRNGEIIEVLEQIDESFLYGRNERGDEGQFLINCVEIIEGDLKFKEEVTKKSKWWEKENHSPNLEIEKEDAQDPFQSTLSSNSTLEIESKTTESDSDVFTNDKKLPSNYAQSVYPYTGGQEDELSFDSGETIYVSRYINNDWLEGELRGSTGIFPATFIQFVDKPIEKANAVQENLKVLYSFNGTSSAEISVQGEEIVKVLEKLNESWYMIENYLGETGLCPASYLGSLTEEQANMEGTEMDGSNNNNDSLIKSVAIDDFLKESVSTKDRPSPLLRKKPEIKPKPVLPKGNVRLSTSLENIIAKEMEAATISSAASQKIHKPSSRRTMSTSLVEDKSSKLIPSRPAPPRPIIPEKKLEPKRPPPPNRSPLSVQLNASPDGRSTFYQQAETFKNAELISEMEKKLEAFDRDIAEYTAKLDTDIDDKESIAGIIRAICEDRETVLQSLYDLDPQRKIIEENKKRKKYKREKAIQELVETEGTYLRDMTIAYECLDGYPKNSGTKIIDFEFLTRDLVSIVKISAKLHKKLREEFIKSFEKQRIGDIFIKLESELTSVYSEHCTKQENVMMLLEKYANDQSSKAILAELQNMMANHSQANSSTLFDLPAIFSKPFQRILKYKLLLSNILTSSEQSHPDFKSLTKSVEVMSRVTMNINEKKRGKDLVKKYKISNDSTLAEKVAKVNMHSTMKKISRFSQRVVGVFIQDEQFNKEEARLYSLQRLLTSFSQGVSVYLRQLHEVIRTQENFASDINEFYAEKSSEVEKFSELHALIGSSLLEDFRAKTNERVLQPINTLLTMFMAPIKLIKKRRDKLCDYETERAKSYENSEAGEDALNMTRKNYEALNAQLLSELPKLCIMTEDTLKLCCMIFLRLQSKFYNDSLKTMYDLLPLSEIIGDSTNFMSSHSTALNAINQISFVPKKPSKDRKSETSSPSPSTEIKQTEEDKAAIITKYKDVWMVTTPTTASNISELVLSSGSLVGVIKNFDPSGNTNKWFVDTGSAKGLVPSSNLVKYKADSGPSNLPMPEVVHCFNFSAVYDFRARNDSEISIARGDCLEVLITSDTNGNDEWWYVRKKDGRTGYVPANYIKRIA